jgi:zinc protease
MVEELLVVVHDEMKKIADNGPLLDDFQKTGTNIRATFEYNQKMNSYWIYTLHAYYLDKVDLQSTWQKAFSKTDSQAIQNLVKEMLNQNVLEIVMLPE